MDNYMAIICYKKHVPRLHSRLGARASKNYHKSTINYHVILVIYLLNRDLLLVPDVNTLRGRLAWELATVQVIPSPLHAPPLGECLDVVGSPLTETEDEFANVVLLVVGLYACKQEECPLGADGGTV